MTPEKFSETPLGIDMAAKHGWGIEDFAAAHELARELKSATDRAGGSRLMRSEAYIRTVIRYGIEQFGLAENSVAPQVKRYLGTSRIDHQYRLPQPLSDFLYVANIINPIGTESLDAH